MAPSYQAKDQFSWEGKARNEPGERGTESSSLSFVPFCFLPEPPEAQVWTGEGSGAEGTLVSLGPLENVCPGRSLPEPSSPSNPVATFSKQPP